MIETLIAALCVAGFAFGCWAVYENHRSSQAIFDSIRATGRTVEVYQYGTRTEFRCGGSLLLADHNEHGLECVDWVLDDQHPGNFRSMAACCHAYADFMEGQI